VAHADGGMLGCRPRHPTDVPAGGRRARANGARTCRGVAAGSAAYRGRTFLRPTCGGCVCHTQLVLVRRGHGVVLGVVDDYSCFFLYRLQFYRANIRATARRNRSLPCGRGHAGLRGSWPVPHLAMWAQYRGMFGKAVTGGLYRHC